MSLEAGAAWRGPNGARAGNARQCGGGGSSAKVFDRDHWVCTKSVVRHSALGCQCFTPCTCANSQWMPAVCPAIAECEWVTEVRRHPQMHAFHEARPVRPERDKAPLACRAPARLQCGTRRPRRQSGKMRSFLGQYQSKLMTLRLILVLICPMLNEFAPNVGKCRADFGQYRANASRS